MNQLKRAIMWKKENYEENDYLLTTPHQMRKVTVQKKKYLRNIVKSNFGSYNSNQNTQALVKFTYNTKRLKLLFDPLFQCGIELRTEN